MKLEMFRSAPSDKNFYQNIDANDDTGTIILDYSRHSRESG